MTSSAVVGSSAISSVGVHASAIAIITRWRMPPDSWCGYSPARRVLRNPHEREHLDRAVERRAPRQVLVQRDGLGDLIADGHHRIEARHRLLEDHAIRLPRIARICAGGSVSRSLPSKRMLPATMRPDGGGTSRMIDSAVTDLPQPLSPTTPSVSPRASESDTPSTALTTPSRVWKCVRRSLTDEVPGAACRASSHPPREPRIEHVAQSVADAG